MRLSILAFWHNITICLTRVWNVGKQRLRQALGPAPQQFLLLSDGRVLPDTMNLPESIMATVFIYDPLSLRIFQRSTPNTVRFRQLPYIAAGFNHPSTGEVDISDWVGEIRANPVPELSVKQLLTLWSYAHNRYVPLSDGVQVSITKNDGETDLITLDH